MTSTSLFTPASFGGLEARNRIAMPAIHLGMAADERGAGAVADFYATRARAGAGVITVGVCDTTDGASSKLAGALRLASEKDIPPMALIASAIRGEGAIAGVQLSPLVGYNDPRWRPDVREVEALIDGIGRSAALAGRAGFQFVELMLSGGGFLGQMVSSAHNVYALSGYSGGWAQRLRAPLESLAEIRRRAGDIPVTARIHCHEFLDGGFDNEGATIIARALADAGVAALNITGGGHRTNLPQLTWHTPPLAFAHLAGAISRAVPVPTFFGGRLRSPDEAERALAAACATFVNLGRALVADPDWPRKAASGSSARQVACMACGGCFDDVFSGRPIHCSLNPSLWDVASRRDPIGAGRRVLVVGGGPAGMQAASTAADLGCEVTLAEKGDHLGGRWAFAAALEGRDSLRSPLAAFEGRLEDRKVIVRLGLEVTPEIALRHDADAIILATGARRRTIDLPGLATHPNVLFADEVLACASRIGDDIAVIGGGGAGVEIAAHLASPGRATAGPLEFIARFGAREWLDESLAVPSCRRVTLMKRRGYVGKGLGRSVRWAMLRHLEVLGVRVLDRVRYEAVLPHGIEVFNGRTGERELIGADTIVLATGYETEPDLVARFEGCAGRVVAIGDAREVADIGAAVAEGWQAALLIAEGFTCGSGGSRRS